MRVVRRLPWPCPGDITITLHLGWSVLAWALLQLPIIGDWLTTMWQEIF